MTYNIVTEHIRFLEFHVMSETFILTYFHTNNPKKVYCQFFIFYILNLILFIFLYSRFLLLINFIHISVYMSIPVAQFITPPSPPPCDFPPLVSIRLFSTSVSQPLSCKPVHLYHFSRFHIHALIYDICFSLSDLLHSMTVSRSIHISTF